MDAKLKAGWVKALRGGRYKQTSGCLRDEDNNEYCCLGVLCRVAKVKWKDGEFVYGDDSQFNYLPQPFREKIELDEFDMKRLARMNDTGGKSFAEIADYIEQNL